MEFSEDSDRAEAYKVLADIFLEPPAGETLTAMKEDFELESGESEEEIRGDFFRLLSGSSGAMPPLESLYSPEGAAAVDGLLRSYADAGLTLDEEFQLTPDHLSVEFLFMSYLIETRRSEIQKKFLEEHLMNWVPYYCEKMAEEAGTLFFREIAEIMGDFLRREYEGIE